jgi:hypothetical protein
MIFNDLSNLLTSLTFLLSINMLPTQSVLSQPQTLPIVSDGLIGLVEDQMTYYNFTVPEDAVTRGYGNNWGNIEY